MKLVASMMVGPGEQHRYLETAIRSLAGFCDEIRVRWEMNPGAQVAIAHPKVVALCVEPSFYDHEGDARQELLDWTFEAKPTHVLAIDADEFVSNGAAIRAACERDDGPGAWTLPMQEVWSADARWLYTRQDGGWRTHPAPILYRAPELPSSRWRIMNRALACGREPIAVRQLAAKALPSGSDVLHFGWANRHERQARYDRYAAADGGRFHASSHLQSILAPDRRVRLKRYPWPAALEPYRETLVERANRQPVSA